MFFHHRLLKSLIHHFLLGFLYLVPMIIMVFICCLCVCVCICIERDRRQLNQWICRFLIYMHRLCVCACPCPYYLLHQTKAPFALAFSLLLSSLALHARTLLLHVSLYWLGLVCFFPLIFLLIMIVIPILTATQEFKYFIERFIFNIGTTISRNNNFVYWFQSEKWQKPHAKSISVYTF